MRALRAGEGPLCEAVLRDVPDWFGIEESLLNYVREAGELPTWVAEADGETAGFITVRRHWARSAEIHCMAVKRRFHRRGVGRAMVGFVERWCAGEGVEFLQVKTMGPSRPCGFYAQTTAFYEAVGFVRLEEFKGLWGKLPALQLVKRVEG